MKYYNYTDLGITSAKKPSNTHLIWEVSTSLIYMIDSTAKTVLLKSVDKGENWTTVETRTYNIISGWHDRANDKIYFVDGDSSFKAVSDDFESWFVNTTNDNITEMGAHNDANGYIMVNDIIKLNTSFYILGSNYNAANDIEFGLWKWVDPNWVFQAGHGSIDIASQTWSTASFALPVGTTDVYYWRRWVSGGNKYVRFIKWDTTPAETSLKSFGINVYNAPNGGLNQFGIAYDDTDKFYMVLEKDADSKNYLIEYSITGGDATEQGEYNVCLMLDRNTDTGVKEKAFHLTEYKIYQFQENTTQLNLIAVPDTGEIIIGITDNFLITTTGKMFEYEDLMNSLITVDISHEIMEYPYAVMTQKKDTIPVEENMFVKLYANYTTAGVTAEGVIFEGIITHFSDTPLQTIFLRSLAKKDLDTRPSGDKTVDSDGMITSIISSDCEYITAGTLTDGADLGTITLGGELTSEFIFDVMAYFENWIWYLTPTGALYFNDGMVDTTENLSETSKVFNVKNVRIRESYNKIKVKGSYVDGVQVESEWKEDLKSQQVIGINRKTFDLGILDTIPLNNTTSTNLLTRLAIIPKVVKFNHQDASIGFMQPGETITFEFESEGLVIASDQYLIVGVVYNDQDIGYYTITDELI